MSTTALSLFNIEHELLEIIELRETVASEMAFTPEQLANKEASIAAIDKQICAYAQRELTKADGIAWFLDECANRSVIYRAQADEMRAKAKLWEAREERIRDATVAAMQLAGKTRIEGQAKTLSLAACPASVEVPQPELVPAEYQTVHLKMRKDVLDEIVKTLRAENEAFGVAEECIEAEALLTSVQGEPEIAKTPIAEVLKCPTCRATAKRKKCLTCGGTGLSSNGVPGTVLVLDRQRLKVD